MSIPDTLIADYFELLTDIPDDEVAEIRESVEKRTANPMEAKKRLAREITAQFHDEPSAREAEDAFTRTFSKRETPEDIPSVAFLLLICSSAGISPKIRRGAGGSRKA